MSEIPALNCTSDGWFWFTHEARAPDMPSALDCMAMYIARYLIYTVTVHNKIHESKKTGASLPPDCQQDIIRRLWAWEPAQDQICGVRSLKKISHGTRNLREANNVGMFNMSLRFQKSFYLACNFWVSRFVTELSHRLFAPKGRAGPFGRIPVCYSMDLLIQLRLLIPLPWRCY